LIFSTVVGSLSVWQLLETDGLSYFPRFFTLTMDFINPPPYDDEGDSPSYDLNNVITVRWTEVKKGTATSLTLWQLNSTTRMFFGDMEYITSER
jgi:hypothetical protein